MMKQTKWLITAAGALLLAVIAGGLLLLLNQNKEDQSRETLYVSSAEKTVEIVSRDGEETLTVVRGMPLDVRIKPVVIKENKQDEGKEYRLVFIDEKEYLMTDDQLCSDIKDAVLEKSGYVCLPAVLYKDASGPAISSMAEKGSEAEIIGFGKVLSDGSVDRYLVNTGGEQGYIRSEYIVKDEAEIKDTVADFQYEREDNFGGGDAYTLEYPDLEKGNFADNPMPKEVRAIYLNRACIDTIDDYIAVAKDSDVNAFIIDMKESDGPAYQSEVIKEYSPSSYAVAENSFESYKEAVRKCRDAGIYVIGRIVTFKDDYYAEDHPEYALADSGTGDPYILSSAYWPSPYQRAVWEYNIRLAIEGAEEIGFNEINFDYIRFPDLITFQKGNIDFRNTYDETMAQAINRFLLYARDELHERGVYLSCDVFGETSNDYVAAYGQYWPMMSNIADVMSAMPYPDHFDTHAYGIEQPVWTVPYELLSSWGSYVNQRQQETPSPAKVRTWLQGYDTYWKYPNVEYTAEKISEQIEGLYSSGLNDGYMVWNAPSELWRYQSYASAMYDRTGE